ncbi:nucleotidyltransferase domain-containing protein [Candidatus Woesearchaeota archaeon]|nr:nucleotidyltransferase domain-containing protein [Candidatus Woesearchaeota archaeon]
MRLIESWKNNLFNELSIAEIMKISGKKTKPWVFNTLKQLTKHQLLLSKKKGNLNLYSLNLPNPFLIQTLQYLEVQKNMDFPQLQVIEEAISIIPVKTYCLLVFGSYAEGKQRRDSDLDICFLVESKAQKKKIIPYFNEIKLRFPVSIDVHYITFDEFIKMLLHPEENLAKQILNKHILFYNPDIYYQLLREAYKHGFRP